MSKGIKLYIVMLGIPKGCRLAEGLLTTGCARESETKFEEVYLHEKCNFLNTFWYHWIALSMYFQNHTSISQLC